VLKAILRNQAGQPIVLLGLSGENFTRMAAGEQVRVVVADLAATAGYSGDVGGAVEVLLMYGRTEADIIAELKAAGIRIGREVRE
jgi:hypothetical protein